MGTSFAADGNVVTSDTNFMRIFPNRNAALIDVGFIRLRQGANPLQVQADLQKKLNDTVYIFTFSQLVKYEQDYWNNNAPIGLIFGFGVIMGLVVGMVIVYQILFTDITNHLNEYATLKAMGYRHSYLVAVVFSSAFLLAILGFIPGFAISLWLYSMAEKAIYIPFPMPLSKIMTVLGFIVGMCSIAGLLAIRKLRAANPADLF
jgi:putative ABC transport system permease protein